MGHHAPRGVRRRLRSATQQGRCAEARVLGAQVTGRPPWKDLKLGARHRTTSTYFTALFHGETAILMGLLLALRTHRMYRSRHADAGLRCAARRHARGADVSHRQRDGAAHTSHIPRR
jgi:hypothetical protein